MGASEQFAKNVVDTRFESLDKTTIQRAKWRILDGIGCAIAGANGPGCQALLTLVKRWGGAAESTVIAHGVKVPTHNAAMMNSLMTRSFDFEAVEAEGEKKTSPAHISGTTVPTALSVAEREGSTGKQMITALAVGEDLAARLGVASGFDFELGWDNTGTINRFGATAITSKLLGLNEKQVFNAFGIVLNQVSGTMAGVFDKTLTFKLPISLACRDAIFSAELAQQGYPGVIEPFLGPRGYFKLYCHNYNTDDLVKDLGKRYYADCVIKPYSACRATHPSIDCALAIALKPDFKVTDVDEIVINAVAGVVNGFTGQPFTPGETPQVDGAFSIRYTVATSLLRKGVKPQYFSAEYINDPQITNLINKMKLIATIPPEKAPMLDMQVKMKDGKTFTSHTDFPRGDFRKTPLTDAEIKEKYRSNVGYSQTVSRDNSEKVIAMVDHLEDLDDVRKLFKLLVKS
jgi:2-methylcitrate dehydratase PrpD